METNVTRRQTPHGPSGDGGGDDVAAAAAGAHPNDNLHGGRRPPQPLRYFEETMTDLRLRVTRTGWKGVCGLGLSLLLSLVFYYSAARYLFLTRHSEDVYFLKMETCPACYGNDFCEHFLNSEVTFTGAYQYPLAHRLRPNTRVFEGRRGKFNGHPVMIKSLATPEHLARVQRDLCEYSRLRGPKCNMRDALWMRLPLGEDTLTLYDLKGVNDMFRCPSQRLLGAVKDAFRLRDPDKPSRLLRNEEMSLLFTALVNPEPLLLMTFAGENGWPFPKYFGACGRFTVVEHRGQPASDFLTSALSERLLVSKRILEVAIRLTSSDTNFALYPSDWDLSNFAVYPDTRTVTLVDLSNVTVVDKLHVKSPPSATQQHHVTGDLGSIAEARAVCDHRLSDWNVLSACTMLRQTLMKDLEPDTEIGSLLDQCASGEPKVSRFQLAKSIIAAEIH